MAATSGQAAATTRKPATKSKSARKTRPAPLPAGLTILQPLVWPDSICSERDLFLRMHGAARVSQKKGEVSFEADDFLQFDTYFNLFNIGKWTRNCDLREIGLQVAGKGKIELTVFITYSDRSWGRLVSEVVELDPTRPQRFVADLAGQLPERGLLFFEVKALSDGVLTHAAWDTLQKPRQMPKLALAVTTFKRERAVQETVARFEKFAQSSRFGDHIRMIVVDNGRSAQIPDSKYVTSVDNENLGGAGGFTRGLLEARSRGFTHCLFMDDDASTPMDAFERTWVFLAYATDPATCVAGAMISTRHAWAIWENGAIFDGGCRPLHGGTDLRDADQVRRMEYISTRRQPDNFYGGWWFFAFAVDQVEHLPFPFFVRGDDVSFSLVHDFNIVTLPGVVSFQESFTEKDSPLTWYLDLRSHLAHHLSLPSMEIGAKGVAKMALWFWGRTFITCHYETMQAVNIAMEDVLRGPEFFGENADMATRRAELGKIRQTEQWSFRDAPPPEKRRLNPHNRFTRMLMKLSLNGLLIPGFRWVGNKITLPPEARWNIREHWGVYEVTYFDAGDWRAYSARHNKRKALKTSLKSLKLVWKIYRSYPELLETWRKAYPELTDETFWHNALKFDTSD